MFIVACRSNEAGDLHPLLCRLLSLANDNGCGSNKRASIHQLDLMDLSLEAVNEIIAAALQMEGDRTMELAKVVFAKTNGNVFYTKQLLEALWRNEILFCSDTGYQWEMDRVREEATVSANVMELVGSKLKCLPQTLQEALQIASFTRSVFDSDTLEVLMEYEGYDVMGLQDALDVGVREGVLENAKIGSTYYRFTHDFWQEVSRKLLLDGRQTDSVEIRVRIGKQLVDRSRTLVGEPWMLFVGVDHLNTTSSFMYESDSDIDGLVELAGLNLLAAEKAIQLTAFAPASLYLRKGREALLRIGGEGAWSDHYELALNIFREGADVEFCLENFQTGDELSQVVLRRARNIPDKLPTYLSFAKGLGRQERHAESLDICRTALTMLGAYPNRCRLFQILKDYYAVKRYFRRRSDFDILLLPRLTDKTKLIELELWFDLALRSYYCGKNLELLVSVLRPLLLTLKYGMCTFCAVDAFACNA